MVSATEQRRTLPRHLMFTPFENKVWIGSLSLLALAAVFAVLERRGWRFLPLFEPRDLWIGVFVDTKKRRVYVLPLPTLGIIIEYP